MCRLVDWPIAADLGGSGLNRVVGVMTDQDRERLIEMWRQIIEFDPDAMAKQAAALRMRSLIADRTLEQVQRMETERGLRAS